MKLKKNIRIYLWLFIIIVVIFIIYKLATIENLSQIYTNKININIIFSNMLNNSKFKKYTPVKISNDPWIITFDTFLTPKECKLLSTVPGNWYHSETTGENKNYRNSYSYDCNHNCLNIDIVKLTQNKIEEVTTIDKNNYEDMTLTKYYKGGYFKRHHDYVPKEHNIKNFNNIGPRILTCLIYLTDNSTDNLTGGATSFYDLGYDIKPKMGRALIWSNVNNNMEKENKTVHEALIVNNGTKIISQTWIHPKKYIL